MLVFRPSAEELLINVVSTSLNAPEQTLPWLPLLARRPIYSFPDLGATASSNGSTDPDH